MCPVFAGAWLTGLIGQDNRVTGAIGEWGSRSLRSVIVGGPPVLAFQLILGSSRPGAGQDSKWDPFNENHGVSGHTFIGAIPFLSAAEMVDNRAVKYLLYAGSSLAGLSRVNDDMHYTSQVLLGWWMAYLAETSVDRSENNRRRFTPVPVVIDGHPGVALTFTF
jgi:membrane-associated phospholipid phosphatase